VRSYCWRAALFACLAAAAFLLASGGGGSTTASARLRPPEPLPRLSGPALALPTRMFIVTSNDGGRPFVVDVDRQTARAVRSVGVRSSNATPWGPHIESLRATVGGALGLVGRQSCQRCALSQVEFLIDSDGSARRIATLPTIVPSVTGETEMAPTLNGTATWVLRWPHSGPCTLRRVPGTRPARRVPRTRPARRVPGTRPARRVPRTRPARRVPWRRSRA
jgi:hypothetical protein